MPITAWTPVPMTAADIPAERSPSPMSRMRAPLARISPISFSWRGRSRTITTRSSTSRSSRLGDCAQIVGHRRIQVDRALAGGAHDNFFHVQIGRVKQAALFARGENRDRAGRAGGAEVGAFERVDGDIHGGEIESSDVLRGADFFADEEHGRLVAFALADNDRAVHGHFIHYFAHGRDGGLIGHVAVSQAHRFCRFNGRLFDDAQKFQTQFDFHRNPAHSDFLDLARVRTRSTRAALLEHGLS